MPTVLELNDQVRYWRNRGDGRFDLMRTMETAPAGVRLSEPGVQLLDANGNGRADLMVIDGAAQRLLSAHLRRPVERARIRALP